MYVCFKGEDAYYFTTGLRKMMHALFFRQSFIRFGLEGKGYKDFKIAGIKGLSKIAQEYYVLPGMFLCQKKLHNLYVVLVFILNSFLGGGVFNFYGNNERVAYS